MGPQYLKWNTVVRNFGPIARVLLASSAASYRSRSFAAVADHAKVACGNFEAGTLLAFLVLPLAVEQDPARLLELVREINRLMDEKRSRLAANDPALGAPQDIPTTEDPVKR